MTCSGDVLEIWRLRPRSTLWRSWSYPEGGEEKRTTSKYVVSLHYVRNVHRQSFWDNVMSPGFAAGQYRLLSSWEERAIGRAYRIGQQKPLPLSRQSKRAHWITTLADAANDTSSSASPEMDVSLPMLQPSFNPINTTSASRFLIAPGVEDQNFRKFVGPIDREASAKTAYSISAFQVAPQRAPSIASSVGESENHSSPATFQVASTPGFPSHRRSKPSALHARTFLWEPVPAP